MSIELLAEINAPPSGLFWSAPAAPDTDFTAEDPLALDYLGQQAGLWLFPGFTTRTNRAQYYAVVLYGLWMAERAIDTFRLPANDEVRTRLFERWERYWALATLESRRGALDRGDPDAMRGVKGARRAWFAGEKPLPLDFPLISRQSELGGLGAYLSSLRHHGLVGQGSMRVTPLAREILEAFWSEPGDRDWRGVYEEYVLSAMDPAAVTLRRSIPTGRLSLDGVGRRSRLTSVVSPERAPQRERLWNVLFARAPDRGTLQLAECVIAAGKEGVTDSEPLLGGIAQGRWGKPDPEVRRLAELGLAFGRFARASLDRFNRAYRHVDENGWATGFASVAAVSFPTGETNSLRSLARALVKSPDASRFEGLQFHGPGFMALARAAGGGSASDQLRDLLRFHGQVQKARRGAAPWLRQEAGRLVMQLPGYTGHRSPAEFPSLKFHTVRQLLADLKRLA